MTTTTHNHRIDLLDLRDQIVGILWSRVLPIALIANPAVNAVGDRLFQSAGLQPKPVVNVAPSATGEGSATHFQPSAHKPVPIKIGDTIGGYRVSSGYGPRRSPCPGCSSNHPGIDLATPTGTPLHAVGEIEVVCRSQGAAGKYAEFVYQGILHQALHLDSCTPGSYTFGQVFAKTGSTGLGTGPHLDVRVKQDGQRVLPAKEVIHAMLAPQDFKVAPDAPADGGQALSVDAMSQATQLIKEFEGFHETPYWDYAQWTWGYGT